MNSKREYNWFKFFDGLSFKTNESNLSYYLTLAGVEVIDSCISQRAIARNETLEPLSRI